MRLSQRLIRRKFTFIQTKNKYLNQYLNFENGVKKLWACPKDWLEENSASFRLKKIFKSTPEFWKKCEKFMSLSQRLIRRKFSIYKNLNNCYGHFFVVRVKESFLMARPVFVMNNLRISPLLIQMCYWKN